MSAAAISAARGCADAVTDRTQLAGKIGTSTAAGMCYQQNLRNDEIIAKYDCAGAGVSGWRWRAGDVPTRPVVRYEQDGCAS